MRYFSVLLLVAVSLAQQPEPKRLVAQVSPGETRVYDFEQDVRISSVVEPRFEGTPGLVAPTRAYRLAGQFTIAFFPPADPSAATLRFQQLRLLSTDNPATHRSMTRLLKQLEARAIKVRWAGSEPAFEGMDKIGAGELDQSSVEMLQMMLAQALNNNASDRPVKAGDRWIEYAGPQDEAGTHNWYQRDASIAGRACAVLLFERQAVSPQRPFDLGPEPRAAGLQGTSSTGMLLTAAAVFDQEAQRVPFTKSAVTTETAVGLIHTDRDAEVRVPIRVMTVRIDADTVTRLQRSEVAGWDKELAQQVAAITLKPGMIIRDELPEGHAFAKPAAAQPAPEAAGDSLAEAARRAREAKKKKPN